MPNIKVESAPVKIPLQRALAKVQEAIAEGEAAVVSSGNALAADPGNAQKQANHTKNQMLLEKAQNLKAGLEMSVQVSNMMCPQQVAALEFDFVQ